MIKHRISFTTAMVVTTAMAVCLSSFKPAGHVMASPSVIIYKTKADYSKNVPLTLSDDKSKILNYPGVKDVYYKGALAYPTHLVKGYLLDNRGVNINTAFLSLTYEEYSKLNTTPAPDDLYKMIIDKEPFKEMYNLGNRYGFKDEVNEINELIEHHKLKEFKKLI